MARLVIQADIDTYGAAIIADGQTPMQLNDVIFFLTDRNAFNNIFNASSFPTARLGATIWLEGGLSSYNSIEIGSSTAITAPSDVDNPNHIHFYNGRGVVDRVDANSLDARELEINNFDYLIVDFETNSHPGLRDGWGSGRGGTFGFYAVQTYKEKNAMALRVENNQGTFKSLEIRGCELSMGSFAKLRASTAINTLEKFVIERCLFTRTHQGEGIYTGLTSGTNRPVHKNTIVRDNIFVATAAEAIQLQQVADGTRVYNNVIVNADIDYRGAFQTDQDTGIQLELVQGDVWVYNNIFYGFGKNCLQIFGRDGSLDGGEGGVSFGSGVIKVFNNYFGGTKAQLSARTHSSLIQDTKVVWRDNDNGSVKRTYGDVGPVRDYHYDMDGTARGVFIGGKVFSDIYPVQNPSRLTDVRQFNITRENVDEPEFINSGFDGLDIHKITRWEESYKLGVFFATSSTSINPALLVIGGGVTLTISTSSASFAPGDKIKFYSRGDDTKFVYASVDTYVGTTLTLELITEAAGSGTATDWDVEKRITYEVDDLVWLAPNEESTPYELYKCSVENVAHRDTRPDIFASFWDLVEWDAAGKNTFDPLYNGTPVTTDFMAVAGDFRLVNGSYHHLKGRGLTCNPQRDDYTMMGWEWKETVAGTVREIPGAYDITLELARYSYLIPGRYYRYWVERRRANGTFSNRLYAPWAQIA